MDTAAIRRMLQAQYDKCLKMFDETVAGYTESLWFDADTYQNPAWQVAFHALFFANIYCSPTEDAIVGWPKLRPSYDRLDRNPGAPDRDELVNNPYTQKDIQEFLALIRSQLPHYLEALEPEKQCWPSWYDEPQLEFHLNNIRHIQHHTAELIERRNNVEIARYRWY